jgi:hypothetical protein
LGGIRSLREGSCSGRPGRRLGSGDRVRRGYLRSGDGLRSWDVGTRVVTGPRDGLPGSTCSLGTRSWCLQALGRSSGHVRAGGGWSWGVGAGRALRSGHVGALGGRVRPCRVWALGGRVGPRGALRSRPVGALGGCVRPLAVRTLGGAGARRALRSGWVGGLGRCVRAGPALRAGCVGALGGRAGVGARGRGAGPRCVGGWVPAPALTP